jgi:hypothetical protein
MESKQESISWIRDAMHGSAAIGGSPIRERVAPLVAKGRCITRLGQEIATEGVGILRDLVHERPLVVFSVVGATALLLLRFGSFRALGTAATIGIQAANMADRQ